MVIDTDGSAFITKAEFDSLKNNFQSQIDNYNSSIDSKIDGAIASYLAGIKISTSEIRNFFNGSADEVLVMNSYKDGVLNWPHCGLDYSVSSAQFSNDTGNYTKNMYALKMTRGNTIKLLGENIRLTDNYFVYYTDEFKWDIVLVYNRVYAVTGTATDYDKDQLKFRWHGQYNGKSTKNVTIDDASLTAANYNPYPWSRNYLCMSATGIWIDTMYGADKSVMSGFSKLFDDMYTANASESDFKKVKWVMDGTTRGSSTSKQYFQLMNTGEKLIDLVETELTSGLNTAQGYRQETPDAADVNTAVIGILCATPGNSHAFKVTSFSWTRYGKYNDDTSTGTVTAGDWYEPSLKLSTIVAKNITNSNFSSAQLANYSGTGWTGTITQGIPIDTFEKPGKISFDIDTTSLEGSCILALSTNPFDLATTQIENTVLTSKLKNFKIDSVSVAGNKAAGQLSAGSHNVSVEIEPGTKTPLFMMISFPTSATTTQRKLLTLPKDYSFVSEN